MIIRRTLAAVAVVTLASTTLVACSDDPKSASSSSDATSEQASDLPASDVPASDEPAGGGDSGDLAELDRDALVTAITENTLKAGSAHITMSMGGANAIKAEGDVSYVGAAPAMVMTMTGDAFGAGGAMEMRFVDKIMYLSIPQMTPAGKFIEIDPRDTSNPMAKSMGDLDKQMDPLNSVKAMQAGVKDVRLVGPETIEGTETNHYEVRVDTAKMLASMGDEESAAAGALPDELVYDMWLDGEDLLRRMDFDFAGSSTTMTMSDYGKPVDVKAPPAAKIVKAPGQ